MRITERVGGDGGEGADERVGRENGSEGRALFGWRERKEKEEEFEMRGKAKRKRWWWWW